MTEGDDRTLKYRALFSRINAPPVSKSDLLPHPDFDAARAITECRAIKARADPFVLSARTGQAMEARCEYLDAVIVNVRAQSRLLP